MRPQYKALVNKLFPGSLCLKDKHTGHFYVIVYANALIHKYKGSTAHRAWKCAYDASEKIIINKLIG